MKETEVLRGIFEHFSRQRGRLSRFVRSGSPNFEDWALWEAFEASTLQGHLAVPRPAYRLFGIPDATKGDLAITPSNAGRRIMIEIKLVTDWTCGRYRESIVGDRAKLARLPDDVLAVQMLILISRSERILADWADWLSEKMEFWSPRAPVQAEFDLAGGGNVVLQAWSVGAGGWRAAA